MGNSRYQSLLHRRDYALERKQREEERRKGKVMALGAAVSTEVMVARGVLGVSWSPKEFAKGFMSIDKLYEKTRKLENILPVYRIAVRTAQVGDLLSPFVSEKNLKWAYDRADVLDEKGKVRRAFQDLFKGFNIESGIVEKASKGQSRAGAEGIQSIISKSFQRLEFRKGADSKAYGDIVGIFSTGQKGKDGKDITKEVLLKRDVFLMERPSLQGGALSGLFEPTKRQVQFFEALSEDSWTGRAASWLGLSEANQRKVRRFGGLVKGMGGSYLFEHVKAMNRFLKEPIPFFDKLFHSEAYKNLASSARDFEERNLLNSFGKTGELFEKVFDASTMTVKRTEALGRLPKILRPYVSSEFFQKTPLRLLSALSAKGALYTKVLPSVYGGLDYLRRKTGEFDPISGPVVGAALFGAAGLGVGSLIKSEKMTWRLPLKVAQELSKRGIRPLGIAPALTKTQVGGALIGGAIGALPLFDKGLTSGFGAAYANARVWASRAWGAIGGTDAVKRQEELLPGITNPMTGVGFVLSGGLLGHIAGEIGTTKKMLGLGQAPSELKVAAEAAFKVFSDEVPKLGKLDYQRTQKVEEAVSTLVKYYTAGERTPVLEAVKEVERVFEHGPARDAAGKAKLPKSFAGVLAQVVHESTTSPALYADSAFAARLQGVSGTTEHASKLVPLSNQILDNRLEEAARSRDIGKTRLQRIGSRTKDALFSKSPSFTRGALRGAALWGAVSTMGAVAAGAMGGHLNPVNLLPGWLIRATGGGESAKATEAVMTGRQEVAVRKSRWWMFGSTPFEGHKISYYRKHRAVLMQSDAADNALYGSVDEKIAYDPVLHPLKALFDPEFKYHREMRLSEISPTPLSGRMFSDVPVLGDVLASTIGQVIKPQIAIRADEWQDGRSDDLFGTGQQVQMTPGSERPQEMRGLPIASEAEAIQGQSLVRGSRSEAARARSPFGAYHTAREAFDRLTDQAGLRGFILSSLVENVGYKDRSYSPVIESADSLLSNRRKFWSLELGDPNFTEAARRYMLPDRNLYYNPLSNMAPSWLPKDDFHIDFKHGNYFRKVQEGEIRLPGAGYETLHPELQGVNPENYGVAHRYKILTDVAFGSKEWTFAQEQARERIQSGKATNDELAMMAETNRQIHEKRKRKAFGSKPFEEAERGARKRVVTVSAVFDDGTFTTAEDGKRPYALAGVKTSYAALVREQMTRHNISKVAEAEERAKTAQANIVAEIQKTVKVGQRLEVEVPADATNEWDSAFTKVSVNGGALNKAVLDLGGEVDEETDFNRAARFNAAQKVFGRAWETFTHNADAVYSPASLFNKLLPFKPQEKFIQRLDPVNLYARTRVYGREISMWQNYKRDFIDSFVKEQRGKLFGDFVPDDVQYNRTLVEYFDKLKWLKSYSLERAAEEQGNEDMAKYWREKKRQTLFGADPYKGFTDLFRALPQTEKDFYKEFAHERDKSTQERILSLVPNSMKGIYIAQWQNQDIEALKHKSDAGAATTSEKSELRRLYNLRRLEGFDWTAELDREYKRETGHWSGRLSGPDAEKDIDEGGTSYADWMREKMLSEYFAHFKLPEKNLVAFDPRVDLEEVKYKVAKNEGITPTDIGEWESRETSMRGKSYLEDAASTLKGWEEGMPQSERVIRSIISHARKTVHLTPLPPGSQNRVVIHARDSREAEVSQWKRYPNEVH